jgi:hypothetical protein
MTRAVLLVAHPCHELLLHGWLQRTRPAVCVLTDGGGRTQLTRDLLQSVGASEGPIFGRFTDAEVYAAILRRDAVFFASLASELADFLVAQRATAIVADATEGYNPVHDLCGVIAGAACQLARRAGAEVAQYEYAVVDGPASLRGESIELDDHELAAKLRDARAIASALLDVDELLARFGEHAFRRETLHRVDDWTAERFAGAPRYERFGEERVAAGRYAHVIRHREHMVPLRDALREWVESARPACVS